MMSLSSDGVEAGTEFEGYTNMDGVLPFYEC